MVTAVKLLLCAALNLTTDIASPGQSFGAEPLVLRRPIRVAREQPIGQILVDMGALSPGDLTKAGAISLREDVPFGEILLAHNMVSEADLFRGLAFQNSCEIANLSKEPPDIRLTSSVDPAFCIKHKIIPWKRVGATTLIATAEPENFKALRDKLPAVFGETLMVVAPKSDILTTLADTYKSALVNRAETRVPANNSCRALNFRSITLAACTVVIALISAAVIAPKACLVILTVWAIIALAFNTGLKAAAAWVTYRSTQSSSVRFTSRRQGGPVMKLPKISLLVPLYQEPDIAAHLIRRLNQLNYPRELLDVCLIVEQNDTQTQRAIDAVDIPKWMRQICVPDADLKTKPRALNYALDFCVGSIIGVYDAEDEPEPDQLFKVARRFEQHGPKVACLQGVLDFYNPKENWLSRCFTIEYATWFRIVLPGIERLGFVIPLGGTTIFFRRVALEEIGAWDAHNVTEDADLGIRLARRGYQTKLIATLTKEEANCRIWPWIRQRSRWLKGYAITWVVHMRDPRLLIAELGAWRFFGLQILFAGTLSQFLLAPVLWSFWALPLGVTHPLQNTLSPTAFYLMTALFFASEFVTLVVGVFAIAPARHRRMWLWVPSLHFYFPLAAIAAYKGIWELVSKPFFWDKTAHGHDIDHDEIEA